MPFNELKKDKPVSQLKMLEIVFKQLSSGHLTYSNIPFIAGSWPSCCTAGGLPDFSSL